MSYEKLSKEDFDAIVTGELTHYAIWIEGAIISIITKHVCRPSHTNDFERLIIRRDGLTFQDKIEILRALNPSLPKSPATDELNSLLQRTEAFKAKRNALAHGVDITPADYTGPHIVVEVVNRAGKEKAVEVTVESHKALLTEAESILSGLKEVQRACG